ncbi:MAG TPA: hypothetical protein VGH38_20380, partial [Bryobacteraceae bacterium]
GFQLGPDADDALAAACHELAWPGRTIGQITSAGNGRAVRTLWERTREAQAGRIMRLPHRSPEDLLTVTAEDVDAATAAAGAST